MTAPAINLWDLGEVVDRALTVLRLEPADADAARIADAAEVAARRVDTLVDRAEPGPVSVTMLAAAVQGTIEEYKRSGASFGLLDSWSTDGFALRISPDPMRGIEAMVTPDKERWGVS